MILLLVALWPGLAGAVALGLAVGWLSGWPEEPEMPATLAGIVAALLGLAFSGLVRGTVGFWIEGAAALALAYFAACLLGSALRRIGGGA